MQICTISPSLRKRKDPSKIEKKESHYLFHDLQLVNMSPAISKELVNDFHCTTLWCEDFSNRCISKCNPSTSHCLTVCVVPLSRGWLRLCVAGSGPRRSSRWFRTLPRWPVWRRLPTVTLCRYTGSTKWLSNAPCRPRMFHLRVRDEIRESGGSEERGSRGEIGMMV